MMVTRPHVLGTMLFALCFCFGCGAGQSGHPTTPRIVAQSAPRVSATASTPRHAMETTGLTGSLSTDEVRRALAGENDAFARCLTTQSSRLPMLAGRLTLAFHVATDGRVARVHPIDSTLGHRDIERCVVDVAASVRFPRPHGGEADFTWPLEMDPPEGVREAITWDPERVSRVVRAHARGVLARCGADGSDFQVTTYVSERGRVISAGASTLDPARAASLDCVANAVRGWRMPRGVRRAKVTFGLRADG